MIQEAKWIPVNNLYVKYNDKFYKYNCKPKVAYEISQTLGDIELLKDFSAVEITEEEFDKIYKSGNSI